MKDDADRAGRSVSSGQVPARHVAGARLSSPEMGSAGLSSPAGRTDVVAIACTHNDATSSSGRPPHDPGRAERPATVPLR